MIPSNNLSVLPWYSSIEQQNARKWWVYRQVYPLFCPAGYILPFQIIIPHAQVHSRLFTLYVYDGGGNVVSTQALDMPEVSIKEFPTLGYDVVVNPGNFPVLNNMANGRYSLYAWIDGVSYYSDVFTVVNDIQPYLKITWWDISDFTMDSGTIVYTEPAFKNVLYLQSDLAKPEYQFEEEGETRDGYFHRNICWTLCGLSGWPIMPKSNTAANVTVWTRS